jgi:hypothetical protein
VQSNGISNSINGLFYSSKSPVSFVPVSAVEYANSKYIERNDVKIDSVQEMPTEETSSITGLIVLLAILVFVTVLYVSISCASSADAASASARAASNSCGSTATQCSGYRQPSCNFDS